MKKILLSSFLALGLGANAQTYFSADFNDSKITDWTRYDADGDGKNWGDTFVINDSSGNPATPFGLISRSWQTNPLTPDNWAVTPAIDLTNVTGTVTLKWTVRAAAESWDKEHYSVYAATDKTIAALSASPVTFSETYDDPANLGTQYTRTLDLSSLAGQVVYVAFRHHNSTDMDFILIDDVVVKSPDTVAPNCPTLTAPANASTGVAVNPTLSWTAGAGASADSYDVYMGTTPNPTTLYKNVTSTSVALTGLTPLTTYYWRVVSKNAIGEATACTEFSFTTKAPVMPDCAPLVSPINEATDIIYGTTPLKWTKPAGTVTGYDVYLGASASSLQLLGTATATATVINITGTTADTTYYWKIVPKNADGSAANCEVRSFKTMASLNPYCGAVGGYTVEPITYVNFKYNTENSSTAATTAQGHENFVSKVFSVEQGATSTISVNSNSTGLKHYYTVFVDWNQDGDFDDAGEKYFTAAPYFANPGSNGIDASKIVTTDFVVPANAALGNTRMRIKAVYGAASAPSASALANMSNACSNTGVTYGQAEDYTIKVVQPGTLAVNDINKANLSVYPNPFKDVLKISDVKDAASVIVSDLSGRMVAELKPAAELNLSHLNKGVYIVNIKYSNGEVKSTKVIKE